MRIRTQLSGLGHYVVCTIVSRDVLEQLMETFIHLSSTASTDEWQNSEIDPWKPFGKNGSLRILTREFQEPEIQLAWHPERLDDAIMSHNILMNLASRVFRDKGPREKTALEVFPGRTDRGWFVQASFGDDIWDIIESPDFPAMLPNINSDIRNWWQDQNGTEMNGQYATRFAGKNGLTLQINQPLGNGLWICGSRKTSNLFEQFIDHNTDYSRDCFAHILSLCIVLEHCRAKLS